MEHIDSLDMKVREPIVEGLFYPESGDKLSLAVNGFLAASSTPEENAFGILCPHAAYEFTGGIMADAFKSASLRKPKRIVILGPVHREQSEELFLPESTIFKTPLGEVPVDKRAVNTLLDSGTLFSMNDIPHLEEHAIEACLPFVQVVFPDRPIVPVLLGKTTKSVIRALISGLTLTCGKNLKDTLFIVSSNLGPYLPITESEKYASAFLGLLSSGSWEDIIEGCRNKTILACGAGAAAAILSLGGPGCTSTLLSRRASNIQPEADRTVQYAAVRFDVR